ncbi:MAG TPA: site-2 protease family protein [Nitrospiraceae bacterium]|jgi:Zn-dependent protease/CBS domain-containing protein|nr:site-2 protease family protein [Nitrospiraceae bacterium]
MFGKRITLFKLFGFSVHVDLSWLVIAALITWSLAQGLFPSEYEGLPAAAYWIMGAAGAVGLFFSIVFHELFHSLAARRFGIPMTGITLFIFGGVAEMDDEPPNPKAEFFMAIAGPLSSIVLGVMFYALFIIAELQEWPLIAAGVLGYLGVINWILAAFNLLPAFPLDGGRVLRSALWQWKNNLRWATRISSQIGSGFGIGIIILGLVSLARGNVVGGIWWFLIGMFLRNASQSSYQQVVVRKALQGEKVLRLMRRNPVTAPPSISLAEFVDQYVYAYHHKMFPVEEGGRLAGCITTRQIKDVPREEWGRRTVGEIARSCSLGNTVAPDLDVIKALAIMNRTGNSRLMVVENGRLAGIISLKDIMGFLSMKMDLESEEW